MDYNKKKKADVLDIKMCVFQEAGVPFTTDVDVSDEAGLPEGLGAGASASNKVSSQAPHKRGDKSESTEETLPMTVEMEPMETEIVHKGGACDSANEQHTGTDEKTVHSIKPEPTPTTLGPYQPNNPVGKRTFWVRLSVFTTVMQLVASSKGCDYGSLRGNPES